MNSIIENIKNRRSVREFDSKKIDKNILEKIVEAASFAPTGMNTQPWRFVVVQDDEFRKNLAQDASVRYKKWLENLPQDFKDMRKEIDDKTDDPAYYGAPVIIFVIGKGMTTDFDCPMACQNIMLSARSFGIGSCWVYIGQFPLGNDIIREKLELKEGEKVYGPIILGYPKNEFPIAPEKKSPIIKWI